MLDFVDNAALLLRLANTLLISRTVGVLVEGPPPDGDHAERPTRRPWIVELHLHSPGVLASRSAPRAVASIAEPHGSIVAIDVDVVEPHRRQQLRIPETLGGCAAIR